MPFTPHDGKFLLAMQGLNQKGDDIKFFVFLMQSLHFSQKKKSDDIEHILGLT